MMSELLEGLNPTEVMKAFRTPISQIDEFVYIGNKKGAMDLQLLKSHKIQNIIQIQSSEIQGFFPEHFNYHLISIKDNKNRNILDHIPGAISYMSESIRRSEKVFVHCDAGASRSGSIIIAYIMARHNFSFEEALKYARKGRACILPNEGFARQVKTLTSSSLQQYFHCHHI